MHAPSSGPTGQPQPETAGPGLKNFATAGPFEEVAQFCGGHRRIPMDRRNASGGQSAGPLEFEHPWDAHTDDQLALLDHLGVERFLVVGFYIRNPLIWNLQ